MFRHSCTLLLLLGACAVLAAPAPKNGWERPIDPDHDCKFALKEGTATLELPGTDHDRKGEQRTCPAFRMRGEWIFNMDMDWTVSWKPDPAEEKEAYIYLRLVSPITSSAAGAARG